jgi:SAM-dependent methyltransferase
MSVRSDATPRVRPPAVDTPSINGEIVSLYRRAFAEGVKPKLGQFGSLASLHQYRHVYAVTLKYLVPGGEALDWGCGNGHFAYFLLNHGIQVTGFSFDRGPDFLVSHPRYSHVLGAVEDPVRLPFPDESYQYVFSVGVLEHVRDTGGDECASMAEIRRVLKPGGYFLCFHFPNRFGWTERLGRALGANTYFHQQKYTRRQIKDMVAGAGFDLLEWGRYNFLPRNKMMMPAGLCDSRAGVAALNFVDDILSKSLRIFTTNHYFVGQKRA